jgi:acylphosphatase
MVTREVALGHGLCGWVRNEADGSVLAVLEGSPAAVDGCLEEIGLRMAAFIRTVSSPRFDDDHGYDGFEIRG